MFSADGARTTGVKRVRGIVIALGANKTGAWGDPCESLKRALAELEIAGLRVVGVSSFYSTEPVGLKRQKNFMNSVAVLEGSIAPAALLRLLKRLERRAGRRIGPRNGPRPLDLDIIDFDGRRVGVRSKKRDGLGLLLPHPEVARRGFVLVPLAEVWPLWRHPVLGVTASALLRRHRHLLRGVTKLEG